MKNDANGTIVFQTKGFKREANARRALDDAAPLWHGCQALIATQGGMFYPVVVYRLGNADIPALASRRIAIVN